MFCRKCGAQIKETSAFCENCGKETTTAHNISNGMQNPPIHEQHPKERVKGLAITGFVFGAAGFSFFPILGLLSLVFGIIAVANNPREPGEMTKAIWKYKNKARGFGIADISLGILCIILLILSFFFSVISAPFSPLNFNFGSEIDEASCKDIVCEHMYNVHKVSMDANESLDEAQVDLDDTGAIISFRGYQLLDGYSLGIPNTIQLDKNGTVVSCEWCRLGINGEPDDITSKDSESSPNQTPYTEKQDPAQSPNFSNTPASGSTCPRCGRTLTAGETCDCTWCDICNAWMLGHGHGEGENLVDSNTAQSGTGSTADYDYRFEGQEITITRYTGSGGDVVIPATIDGKRVTKIGDGAFDIGVNDDIKSVIIPNGVTEIGKNAFRFCHGLTSITVPKSVTRIGDLAFDETNIASVYFEGNAPSGTGFAFYDPNHGATIYYKPGTTGWDNAIWSDFPKRTW